MARKLAEENGIIAKEHGSGKREDPPVDIFDEGGYLVVILDIPGAEDGSIQVNLSEHRLRVLVNSRGRELQPRWICPAPSGR
ncbi:MAG: hypothetical protein ACOY40_07105 [Bacillota bacterium]|jgi:HSP20 family molecular chaperone IbpA